jgi:hypothetical protein
MRGAHLSRRKHDSSLPLIGVTFLPKEHAGDLVTEIELIRSMEEEKGQQIAGQISHALYEVGGEYRRNM